MRDKLTATLMFTTLLTLITGAFMGVVMKNPLAEYLAYAVFIQMGALIIMGLVNIWSDARKGNNMNVALHDLTPPRPKFSPQALWDRVTGKALREAWSAGESLGYHRGLADAAAYCERYGARHHDIRRAALEVCAEHIRAVVRK